VEAVSVDRSTANAAVRLPDEVEYGVRLSRLERLAGQAGVDAVVFGSPDNHLYLGGIAGLPMGRPIWLVVRPAVPPVIIAPRIEASEIRPMTWLHDVREWIEWTESERTPTDWSPLLRAALSGTSTVAVDVSGISGATTELVRAAISPASLVDAGPIIRDWRIRKDDAAIRMLRAAGEVTAVQLEGARRAAVPGSREIDIALGARAAAVQHYAELMGQAGESLPMTFEWFGVVAAGADRSARAHARASARRVADGEIVQLCLCGRPFMSHAIGYDRPLHVGSRHIDHEITRIIAAAREAQEAALDTVRPGTRACDVHAAAVASLERRGLGRYLLHRTGRGVGAGEGEAPELRETDRTPLEAGMVITVEPGCYVPHVGGARFGDTILVTDSGYDPLTALGAGREP
jgi:Xaa-Pro dipeptidase